MSVRIKAIIDELDEIPSEEDQTLIETTLWAAIRLIEIENNELLRLAAQWAETYAPPNEKRSYQGESEGHNYPGVGTVTVHDNEALTAQPLALMLDHVNHSPDGFAWGYGGSGPAQLAYAILWDVTNDADKCQKHYQNYKWDVIANLPTTTDKGWIITAASVDEWLIKAESRHRKDG